jgi:hypothetical protein
MTNENNAKCHVCGKDLGDNKYPNARVSHFECLYNSLKDVREKVLKIYLKK